MVKKKGKGKKEEEALVHEEEEEEDEVAFQNALLEIRVKELETLNIGLQAKCDFLSNQSEDFRGKYERTLEEKEDLVAYLSRSLTEEKTNVKELEDRLFGLKQARTDEAKDYKMQLAGKDVEFNEMRSKLEKSILELNAKLTSLEDFRVQKETLEAEMGGLREELRSERAKFEVEYNQLEDRLILFREKLKNDAQRILKIMAKKVTRAGKLTLAANIRVAIEENGRLKKELETTSSENLNLRERVRNLEGLYRERRMTISVLEEENELFSGKLAEYKELAGLLARKGLEMEKELSTLKSEMSNLRIKVEKTEKRTGDSQEMSIAPYPRLSKTLGFGRSLSGAIGTPRSVASADVDEEVASGENGRLRDVVVALAIASKELTEVTDSKEAVHLNKMFRRAVVTAYQMACDLQNLPKEVRERLIVPAPKVTDYLEF